MSWLRFLGKTLTWLTWIGPKLSPVWRSQFWSNFRFLSRLSAWNEFWMVFDLTRAFWLDVDFQLGLRVDVSLGSVLGHFRSGMSSWVDFALQIAIKTRSQTWLDLDRLPTILGTSLNCAVSRLWLISDQWDSKTCWVSAYTEDSIGKPVINILVVLFP